jgi:glycerol-3-phosphate acyltransferase PlsY
MDILLALVSIVVAYFLGSIPWGVIIVRMATGKDVREVGSGRTGGTNAMRAAGTAAGILTGVLDGVKAAFAVWAARLITGGSWLEGGSPFVAALAGFFAVIGHVYSIFLMQRETDENGQTYYRMKGGAGGGPSVGAVFALWPPTLYAVLPIGLFVFLVIGYASLTTLSFGFVGLVMIVLRAWLWGGPWEHVVYCVLVLLLQLWALRPNIRNLMNGTERVVSISVHGRRRAKLEAKTETSK